MTSPMKPIESCDAFADALSDFLERELAEPMRAAMESHALSCDDCGPLLADLRKLRLDAANLPELAPSHDLWTGIAARIETPVVELGSARQVPTVRRVPSRMWMGLAAAGLVAVTASTTYLLTKRANGAAVPTTPAATTVATLSTPDTLANRTATPGNATENPAVPAPATTMPSSAVPHPSGAAPALKLASNKLSAEATYDIEISRLRKIVDRRRGELDSSTVVVLEKNLKIIDDAIAQCRMALKKDPASAYLNESLTGALDNKVQLLRAAAGLPVKM